MMNLKQEIAQSIVERVGKIIHYSVNVMNKDGYIIASGDKNRLGQLHSGAVISLRENRVFEVNSDLESAWNHTVKQGINLPFGYMGINLGVIGISGDPNHVRQYAELVKIASEFIIEQAITFDRERWDSRYKEELVLQLIYGEKSSEELLENAKFFNIDLQIPRIAIVVHFSHSTSDLLQKLMNYWMIELVEPNQLVAVTGFNEVTLLKPYLPLSSDNNYFKILPNDVNIKQFKIAVGGYFNGYSNLYLSYRTAKEMLAYIDKMYPRKRIANYYDHRMPVLFEEFLNSWQGKELLHFYQTLHESDSKKILKKTLKYYFLNNCDLTHTSRQLHIHVNTLRYRLEKIEQITGLSFNRFDEKLTLYLGTISDY